MSEETDVTISSTEKDSILGSETCPMEEHNLKKALHSDVSTSIESRDVAVDPDDIKENRQATEPSPNEEQNIPLDLRNQGKVEAEDLSPTEHRPMESSDHRPLESSDHRPLESSDHRPLESSEHRPLESSEHRPLESSEHRPLESSQHMPVAASENRPLTSSDAAPRTDSFEKTNDITQPAIESIEISPSMVPPSDKALQEVTKDIQSIYEGMKDMKLNEQETLVSASGKKGRKPASTPRARSTPIKILTSPPVTRSRSRDLRKFPSTPASPARVSARKNSDSDAEEIKGVRGRQRAKKNN